MTDAPVTTAAPVTSGPPAAERQLRLLGDAQLSRAIQVAATLAIADHIADEPRSAEDLARLTGCEPGLLRRLLRYLAFAEVFSATGDGRYTLTEMGRLLCSDEPSSVRAELVIGADDRALWWSTGEMLHTVRTGQPAFDHVYGVSMWEAMRTAAGSSTRFQQAMTAGSAE
ncbi:MAG TPA: hypothetical protein VGS19_38470, partial [Streptosporangiaceae bacterium]|nr:hypothetical protein [Streptosporangiaceae bacterium]